MSAHRPIITLLTDFGEQDDYVGAMKGVILNIVPDVQLVDISHQVKPQNIRQAASILDNLCRYYPPYTIHVVVVDPGVGSERQPIALKTSLGIFIAPDNGVLTFIRAKEPDSQAIVLNNTKYWLPAPSDTFHGRDIFSPVAAHLASGVAFEKLGKPLHAMTLLPAPPLTISDSAIRGEVVRIDRFGNALTNIAPLRWLDDDTLEFAPDTSSGQPTSLSIDAASIRVICGWHTVTGVQKTYSQSAVGQALALVGSSRELEIAINQGNASEDFAIKVGSPVTLQLD